MEKVIKTIEQVFSIINYRTIQNGDIITFIIDNQQNRHFRVKTVECNEDGSLINLEDFDLYFFHLSVKVTEVI